MSIIMIFSLFGIKFNSIEKIFFCFYFFKNAIVSNLLSIRKLQNIGFSPNLGSTMSIRIGNQCQIIQFTHSPIHRRVRRQTCLNCKNMFFQITKSLIQTIITTLGTKQTEPRCPDVCWDHIQALINIQHYLQKFSSSQSQNWPAI